MERDAVVGSQLYIGPSGRPAANSLMRRRLGPACDEPNPSEYIDAALSDEAELQRLLEAFEGDEECTDCQLTCRDATGQPLPSELNLKPLRSVADGPVLGRLLLWLPLSGPGEEFGEERLRYLRNLVRCFP